MTALFRAPGATSEKPPQSRTIPAVQKQEEQDSPAYAQMAEVSPSIPATPARSGLVTRQVISPPAAIPQPFSPPPSTPAVTEPSKNPDPVWKRLQTIFRKHEEHSDSDTADTTDREAGTAESVQPQVREEKDPALPQAATTEEHFLPAQNPTATIPSTRVLQRSSERMEQKPEPTSPNVLRKAQPLPSASPEITGTAPVHNPEFKHASPDKTAEVNDQLSTDKEPEKPSLPLESVWNVQRVEASHPLFHENIPHPALGSRDVAKNETSMKISQGHVQEPGLEPVQLHREDDGSTETRISDSLPTFEQKEEPREPVEILAPSRPRPPQLDLPPKSTSIQRQSQDGPAAKDVSEAPPVNTVIGPLPADLWWLLGQKPPSDASASQPDIQRTIHPNQEQTPPTQSSVSNPPLPAEHPAEAPLMPGTIQRQVLSRDPLPSSQPEPASPAREEETKHAQPDLDDLARRVYAEVRRRLAAEWERRR